MLFHSEPAARPLSRRETTLCSRFGIFPINRRDQGLATHGRMPTAAQTARFSINRRHQRMATSPKRWWIFTNVCVLFPINRRHQRIGTSRKEKFRKPWPSSFQSIGVTKEWRLTSCRCVHRWRPPSFQSIGVTKEWRLLLPGSHRRLVGSLFPINRRHQGLATLR